MDISDYIAALEQTDWEIRTLTARVILIADFVNCGLVDGLLQST